MVKVSMRLGTLLLAVLWLAACGTTAALFSQTAYEQAVGIKVDALALMDKAVEPYSNHQADVAELRHRMDAAYEYAKGRPKNGESTAQWALLRDPNRNLLGGFLKRWEEKGRLSAVFINEAKKPITDALDSVIELESGKRKSGSNS